MKKLNEMQRNFIIKSALNSGKTMEQAEAKADAKEAKMNEPKKTPTYSCSFDEEDESGQM